MWRPTVVWRAWLQASHCPWLDQGSRPIGLRSRVSSEREEGFCKPHPQPHPLSTPHFLTSAWSHDDRFLVGVASSEEVWSQRLLFRSGLLAAAAPLTCPASFFSDILLRISNWNKRYNDNGYSLKYMFYGISTTKRPKAIALIPCIPQHASPGLRATIASTWIHPEIDQL